MRKALYILKHDPWGIGGGSYASLMYLSAFCSLLSDWELDVLICDSCMAHQPECWKSKAHFIPVAERSLLNKCLFVLTGIMHRYQSIGKSMLRTKEYELCIFDHNQIAGTLMPFVPKKTKTVVIHHNVEQTYSRDNTKSPVFRTLLLPHVKNCEEKAYKNAAYNIFLTKEDKDEFRLLYGTSSGTNIIGGIFDLDKISSPYHCRQEINKHKAPVIVITGSLNNVQNTDGIIYFIRELYPHIPQNIKIIIAGKNPNEAVLHALEGHANIELQANVANMSDVINSGDIYLCPARLGSGIKVRVADGLRNGLPVIAHATSARGYGDYIQNGCFFSFATTNEFISVLNTVLEGVSVGKWPKEIIQNLYYATSSFNAGIDRLRGIVDRIV